MKAVTPWKPLRELESLQHRMEQLFERFSERWGGADRLRNVWGSEEWSPAIESRMENGNLIVKADLPGVDPKEVTVSVVGSQLTIAGERKHEEKKEEKDYFYQELSYGKFLRSVQMPEGVEAEKVKATFKNGVLEVTMPAPKQATAKKIQIEAQQ